MHTSPAGPPAPRGRTALWRAIRIGFSLSPLLAVHLALFTIPVIAPTLLGVALALVVSRVAGLGITAGFHRGLTHRSFRTGRVVQFLLAAAGCTALQKGPLWWAAHHRLHHAHSDRPGDPHSPVLGGFWHGHMGWLFTRDLMHPDPRLVRDLARFPELVWLDRLWMLPGLLLAAGCYLADGWSGVVWGFCLGVVAVFQVTFAVNSVGHLLGRRRFDTPEGSRNNLVLGYLAMGDGWHNNHHRAPGSARHGLAWYEFDMTYRVIRLLAWLRLAWAVREPPAAVLAAAHRDAVPPADSGGAPTPPAPRRSA
ncbi:MAG: acyl-CoA desaturase [Planctomycetes bacterium]|nr:acyl-CoA desaturase [Planctomycetota bacterium]